MPDGPVYDYDDFEHQHQPGVKLDLGKAPIFRGCIAYFPRALMHVAKVSEAGAKKYTWNGWRSVPDGFNRYADAQARHAVMATIEDYDEETECLHLAQEAWNALAKLELFLTEEQQYDSQPAN